MPQDDLFISSEQVSDYVVCPESWRLKYLEGKKKKNISAEQKEGIKKREEWLEHYEELTTLKKYAKIAYLLLVAVVIIVFLLEQERIQPHQSKKTSAQERRLP